MNIQEKCEAEARRLKILHRDDRLIAIDKPAGLLVHRSPIDAEATEYALQILRDQIGQPVHPCHRLDRPTSGVLLFALDKETLRQMQGALASQQVDKTYHAVVRGWIDDSGTIDSPLRSEENPNKIQEAQTEYSCLRRSTIPLPVGRYATARFSLVELRPKTGRTHQLRRHMAHIRHPILGDTRHGDGAQNRFFREHCGGQRLMLRAIQLTLPGYDTESKSLVISAGADPDFEQALDSLGLA